MTTPNPRHLRSAPTARPGEDTGHPQIDSADLLAAATSMLSDAVGHPVTISFAPPEDDELEQEAGFEDECEDEYGTGGYGVEGFEVQAAFEWREDACLARRAALGDAAAFARDWIAQLRAAGWREVPVAVPGGAGHGARELIDPTGRIRARAQHDDVHVVRTWLRAEPAEVGARPAWCAATSRTPVHAILAAARSIAAGEAGPSVAERLEAAGFSRQNADVGGDAGPEREAWWLPETPNGAEAFFYDRFDRDERWIGRGWAIVHAAGAHGPAYQVCSTDTAPPAITALALHTGA